MKKIKLKKIHFIIFSIIIIIIVLAAIFIPKLLSDKKEQYYKSENLVIYNYYKFNKEKDNIWYLQLSIKNTPYIIPFYYNPYEAESVYIDNNTFYEFKRFLDLKKPKIIYISVDPLASSKVAVSVFEIKRILGKDYNIFNFDVLYGIHYLHEDNFTNFPVATCNEAREDRIIIILNTSNENNQVINKSNFILTKNHCIIMNSVNETELIRVSDALAYYLLGIFPLKQQ